jgi:hypothetical protein
MRRWLACLCLLLAAPLGAVLHDRDRPGDGLEGDVMGVIAGRFDRPPAEFYRQRHARLNRELRALPASPSDADRDALIAALPVFDDAVVALYRLDRVADALVLLGRKETYTEYLIRNGEPAAREHRLRSLTMRAALLVARYRADQPAGDESDLARAEAHLQRVLELDRYDLEAPLLQREIDWLRAPPEFAPESEDLFPNLLGLRLADIPGAREPAALAALGLAGAPEYLLMRARHGGAWDSVDVFYALSLVLWISGRDEEAITAWLRAVEVADAGSRSEAANAPGASTLARRMGRHLGVVEDLELHQRLYREIRERNDGLHERRMVWLESGLAQGRHPDTHAAFWDGFDQPPPPRAGDDPGREYGEPAVISTALIVGGMTALTVLLFVIGGIALYVGRRHPKAPTVDEV